MAKSLFRQFSSDDLIIESSDWDVADDGQVLIHSRNGEEVHLIADDFFEAAGEAQPVSGSITQIQKVQTHAAAGTQAFSGTVSEAQVIQAQQAVATLAYAGVLSETQEEQFQSALGALAFTGEGSVSQTGQIQQVLAELLYDGTSGSVQAVQLQDSSGTVVLVPVEGSIEQYQWFQLQNVSGEITTFYGGRQYQAVQKQYGFGNIFKTTTMRPPVLPRDRVVPRGAKSRNLMFLKYAKQPVRFRRGR